MSKHIWVTKLWNHQLDIVDAQGKPVAVMFNDRPDRDELARLIAAAPELLEALKSVVDQVGVEDAEQLRALIKKAEGRE